MTFILHTFVYINQHRCLLYAEYLLKDNINCVSDTQITPERVPKTPQEAEPSPAPNNWRTSETTRANWKKLNYNNWGNHLFNLKLYLRYVHHATPSEMDLCNRSPPQLIHKFEKMAWETSFIILHISNLDIE